MTLIASDPSQDTYLNDVLADALQRVQVNEPELVLAKDWREDIANILRKTFPGCRIYYNGSVAHGDALTPLVDVDLGVVIPDPAGEYGPGLSGPTPLQEIAAEALRRDLREKHGDVYVYLEGQTRSILVMFREPVFEGWESFSADVIIAIDNPDAPGLFIPWNDEWDRSDPETHTRLVHQAIEATDVAFARCVRLLKHWSRTHDKPLCSWHIKAIALQLFYRPVTLIDGVSTWFEYAAEVVAAGPVEDPAHVADPIDVEDGTRDQVVRELRQAHDGMVRAQKLAAGGWHLQAVAALADVFKDEEMLPRPPDEAVKEETARRYKAEAVGTAGSVGVASRVDSWGE
jgi:hypothetical protein